ncbi:MAG: metalloregulator ArsR/SmtB family transcription factor [Aminivibrio sp.]|uniref:ArsR/SmtB family transcription factor n=1 Tax=Aminivibrio sp. TaxID=1872489 RepID=UPI002B1F3232|nr:metalloregulator ArsR/SmtB family transcription factor [Aminivibrio sp.]MEA4951550.1 metalloregulator ArsR/SmtB family transcription factor [Aminivibrio sp.]
MTSPESLAGMFKILSVDTRLRILNLLKERPMCVNALACSLKMTAAAVSQHLRILREAELVTPERRGYFIHYRLNAGKLEEMVREAQTFLGRGEE